MPDFRPFTAVHYPIREGASDLTSKIAPPYDVLDEQPKRQLLAGDGHNIVAIDLPVTPPKTVGPDAAYEAAGALYRQWLAEGVLVRDDRPGVVVYEQVYDLDGQTVRRRGLFAVLGVEGFNRPGGGVFRHEKTIAGGIGDRTKLLAATAAQLSPVFGIYPDPQKTAAALLNDVCEAGDPDFHGRTPHDDVSHRCWKVHDPETLATLTDFFRGTDVFIADGHHRYTTALEFSRSEAGKKLPGGHGCLFVLVAAEDPGMVVRPTHRCIGGLQDFTFSELQAILEDDPHFDWQDDPAGARFELIDPIDGRSVGLNTTADPLAEALPDRPAVWRTLDVAVLHELLIERVLRPHFGGDSVHFQYTAERDVLRGMMAADPATRLGVVMRPTPLADVMAVARADEVMPPKSTFFYPKLATGLCVNPLD
jgi:uncharacterized protein (DUF1015 family)